MFLTDLSIKRPVVSMVMSIVMVMFGILVFFEIPTNELPDIDRPVVSVQTDYKGASSSRLPAPSALPPSDGFSDRALKEVLA